MRAKNVRFLLSSPRQQNVFFWGFCFFQLTTPGSLVRHLLVSTHNSKNYVGFPPHKWLVHMAIFHPCSRCRRPRPRRPRRPPVPATKYTHT